MKDKNLLPSKTKTIIVAGLAIFAMFLGAGNIIFPPFLGAGTGEKWLTSIFGFILTGTGLPLLGVIAVAKAGGNADNISDRVSRRFAIILNTSIIIMVGPLFAVPRTAATTAELSLRPYLPQINPQLIAIIGGALFFAICLYFVLSEGNALDKIGTILSPLLTLFLFTIIIIAMVKPIGKLGINQQDANVFQLGFKTGYQTMDGMASIVFGASVATSISAKGFSQKQTKRMLVPVALMGGIGLSLVYLGFAWIGASGSTLLANNLEKTELTVKALQLLAGLPGQIMLSLIIFFACLTTAAGLLVSSAQYFEKLLKHKLSYRKIVLILTGISYLISILGVESIITIAEPILSFVYPIIIVLILMNLFPKLIRYDGAFKGAVVATSIISLIMLLGHFESTVDLSEKLLSFIPLGLAGFGYIVPAVLGGIFGTIIDFLYRGKHSFRDRAELESTENQPKSN